MLKIHATRVPAPTPGHDTGTKWQVVVTFPDDTTRTFDRVQIFGDSEMIAQEDSFPSPHVYLVPLGDSRVVGWSDYRRDVLQ